ncbi:MAG: ABC transporter substrate-binding protein [Dehalococcoidia bacterium]
MNTHRIGLAAALGAALVSLVACSGGAASVKATPAAAPSTTTAATATAKVRPDPKAVSVGYTPLLINAPFYYGIEKGYFLDEGIDLKLQRIAPGTDVLTQTAAGNFNIGSAGIGAAGFNLAAAAIKEKRVVPFEVVAPLHVERAPAATPLVVSKARFESGEITKVSDLKGKRTAINNKGSATEYWLNIALKSGGLSVKDVTVVTMGFQDMAAALQNKSIDGAMLGEPMTTQAKDLGLVRVLTDTFANNEAATAVYWNRDWAAKNPQLADGFLRAFLKSAGEMEKSGWDDAGTIAIIEKYAQVPADVIKRASRPHYDAQGKLDPNGWRALESYFRSQSELTYEGNIDLNAFMRMK